MFKSEHKGDVGRSHCNRSSGSFWERDYSRGTRSPRGNLARESVVAGAF